MDFRFLLLVLSLVFSSQFLIAQKSYNALVYEGNKKFDAKEYDASSSKYVEAIAVKNGNYTAHYNLGNALYKSKKYEEAAAEYQNP
jgi:tetratricopeptide (TPR) repeat protein